MAQTNVEKQRKYRATAKGKEYFRNYIRERRAYFKKMYDDGYVKYEDVPKCYRYWVKKTFSEK